MGAIFTNIAEIFAKSGWAQIFFTEGGWKYAVMLAVACVLLYLAIVKQFEPLLLLPIGFGMLMTNLPLDGIFHMDIFINSTNHIDWALLGSSGGMVDYIYLGVKLGIYPPLIFLGIGTMTDFEPLIARPSSLLLGAAAQLGIFFTFVGAKILGFTNQEAGAIGIIGGADGPTAIYVTTKLAPHLLGSIAVAAYCYMALVPVIQPPIMKALTTEKERQIVMTAPRRVSKTEKILFPIIVTIIVALTLPDAAILVGCLMLGNLMKESGVVDRIQKTAGNELMNIITIFLALSVGCTTSANTFLNSRTLFIIVLGLIAFSFGTAAGVLCGKVMYALTGAVMKFAPLAVFALIAPVVAQYGPSVLLDLLGVIALVYGACLAHALVVYSTAVSTLGRTSPLRFFKECAPAALFAFSSSSSAATLPFALDAAERLGASHPVRSFVLPLGATINMDGTAIYQGVCALFIANAYGIPLSLSQQLAIVLTCTLASIGTAGVPGAGTIMLSMVLTSAGLPIEGVSLVWGVDRVLDMARTTLNVTGDIACSVVVSRTEPGHRGEQDRE